MSVETLAPITLGIFFFGPVLIVVALCLFAAVDLRRQRKREAEFHRLLMRRVHGRLAYDLHEQARHRKARLS